jgi:hypothetical protein
MQSYKDLTVLKFQEIHNAILISEGNEIREAYNVLSVLTGVSVEVYKAMKYKDFQKECEKIAWLSDAPLPDKYVNEFECQGEKFTIVQHATDWTTEQFISMSTLTKSKEQIVNNIHLILATLTKGCDTMTEHNRRSALFQNHLSIEIAYPTAFFFAQFLATLSQTSQFSSHVKKKENLAKAISKSKKMQNGSVKNGIGTTQ